MISPIFVASFQFGVVVSLCQGRRLLPSSDGPSVCFIWGFFPFCLVAVHLRNSSSLKLQRNSDIVDWQVYYTVWRDTCVRV